MARSKYRDVAFSQSLSGNVVVVPYPSITVYEPGTTTPIAQTLYAGPSGGVTLPNPFVGNADGSHELFLNTPQDIKLVINGAASGLGTATIDWEPVPISVETVLATDASGTLILDGPFWVAPAGAPHVGGIYVDQNGRIGMIDQAFGGTLSENSSIVATTQSSLNEVFFDIQMHNNYPGLQATNNAGTVGAGSTTSTIVDTTKSWVVNQWTAAVAGVPGVTGNRTWFFHTKTGTGAGQFRQVVSNTANTVTVTPALGGIDTSTTYEIVAAGDMGASRFIMAALAGNIASTRAVEVQIIRRFGSASTGMKAMEVGVHNEVADTNPIVNMGIDLFSSTAFLDPSLGGGPPLGLGQRAGIALNISGDLGWYEYLRISNTAGALEATILNGGHITSNTLTVGTMAHGTNPLTVKQSSNGTAGGIQLIESAAAVQSGYLYVGPNAADAALYLQAATAGVGTSIVRIGSRTGAGGGDAAFRVSTNDGGTTSGLLADFQNNNSSRASIRADGAIDATIGGVATRVFAGAVNDGGWSPAPPNGTLAIDNANGRLYFRYNGAWHFVTQTA